MIQFVNVSKVFPNGAVGVEHVNLEIEKGETR
jgi:ABC-type phosphate/phosphonate transport system ATPase subunit